MLSIPELCFIFCPSLPTIITNITVATLLPVYRLIAMNPSQIPHPHRHPLVLVLLSQSLYADYQSDPLWVDY